MPLSASRSVVIISGLLTLLVLGGGTLAVGFRNGWLRTASESPSRQTAASAQPTPTGSDRDAVARLTEPSPRAFDTGRDSGRGRRLPAEARRGVPSPR